jgi:hypothetical protein
MVEVRMAMISSQSSMRFAMRDGGSQWESPFVATAGLTGAPAGVEDELKLLFAGTTPVTLFPVGTNRVGTGDLLPDHQGSATRGRPVACIRSPRQFWFVFMVCQPVR